MVVRKVNGIYPDEVTGNVDVATSFQDNTVTSSSTPTSFTHEHTVTIVSDNGFRELFESLTGGNLSRLLTNFVVNTYKRINSSEMYEYYQDIDVYIGDDFQPPNLAARICRIPNEVAIWTPSLSSIESIQKVTNSEHVSSEYAIEGNTLHNVKTNKNYVAIRDTLGNVVTSTWKEVKEELDIAYDNNIKFNTPPSYFTAKKTISSYGALDESSFMENIALKYQCQNIEFETDIFQVVVTEKVGRLESSYPGIVQTVYIYYASNETGNPLFASIPHYVGCYKRMHMGYGGDIFYDVGLENSHRVLPSLPYGGTLNGVAYGFVGSTIYIVANSTTYVCTPDLQSGFGSVWKKMSSPTVLNMSDSTIPTDDGEYVYDAESVLSMISGHAERHSSETTLGHVKVDNNTIKIDEDGVISAHASSYHLARVYHEGILAVNEDTVVINAHESGIANYRWEAYENGLLLNPNKYTLTFDEDNDAIVFTRNIVKTEDVEIMLRGERMVNN